MDQNLPERVEYLERRSKSLLLLVLFLTVAMALMLRHQFNNVSVLKHPDRLVANFIEVESLIARDIAVVGSHGKNAVDLGATPDGWAGLYFKDLSGGIKASLMLSPDGKPSLDFSGDKGKGMRITIGVLAADMLKGKGEEFSIQLKDRDGKVIWQPNVKNP